jgi:hypothetical protein
MAFIWAGGDGKKPSGRFLGVKGEILGDAAHNMGYSLSKPNMSNQFI